MSGSRKLASNIKRTWMRLLHEHYRGATGPAALLLSPAAAEALGDQHTWGERQIVDTWSWGWMIKMQDGSFRP